MTTRSTVLCAVAVILVGTVAPVLAHHSFASEFDAKKPVSFQGVVTKVEWTNPHVWFYVDAKDEKGTVIHWECEAGPPNSLARNGWRKDSLKVNDKVSVQGSRSRC